MATNIQSRLDVLEEKTEKNNKILTKLEEALYGNGKPGLLTEFCLLCEAVKKHHQAEEARAKERKIDWQWLVTTVVAISAVLAAIIQR